MSSIDISIIGVYIFISVAIGIYVSRLSSKGLESYFLGGKNIKWYYLGLSNGSGMFDIAGTTWMVGILFLYGVKSFMFMWLWPIWNQIFVMMFLAAWIRKSSIMTGSEWMITRFGDDKAGRASHLIVAIFAIVATIGFISYFFEGVGKFLTIILPWDLTFMVGDNVWLKSEQSYAPLIIMTTTIYTIKGGMFSVVATEVLQYFIMILSSILLAGYVLFNIDIDSIDNIISSEWKNVFFGWELTKIWDDKHITFNNLVNNGGYKLFGAFIGMTIFKGFFASIAGPTPSYDMQRILSTKSVKEASYMSGFTNLLLFIPRYLLIASIVIIALAVFNTNEFPSSLNDLEIILPKVINYHIPVGLKGLLLAGLLAAFMSTFSAFVNAGPAYIVNDIYKKYFVKKADNYHYIKVSKLSTFIVVGLGVFMGFFATSINSITLWITSALFGGYIAANFLKWIWWRFNGWGYFWGMLAGLLVATSQFFLEQFKSEYTEGSFLYFLSNIQPLYLFPITFTASLTGCIVGTYLSKPTETKVLIRFFSNVRPWGWWKPIYDKINSDNQQFEKNNDLFIDMLNCAIGVVWQSSMILMPIYFMIQDIFKFTISTIFFIITTIVLKFTWLDRVNKKSIN